MSTAPIRRRRSGRYERTIGTPERARPAGTGIRFIVGGFALILVLGTILLMLPVAAADGSATSFDDSLFTATSALCVTGLVVVDTQAHWSLFGEIVIAVLIQAGGLGYMAGSAFVLWIFGRRLGVRGRHMLRQYHGAPSMGEALDFVRNVALFALVAEVLGFVILWVTLVVGGDGPRDALWSALFHSISAFNNAGFNITGADLVPYRENAVVLLTISALVIVGGLGAIPVFAIIERRTFRRLPLEVKLILVASAVLLVGGSVFIGVAEWTNPATFGTVAPEHRPVLAFFQTAMSRTAGFSAYDIGALRDETLFFKIGLMAIGGAAGSTAGGMKMATAALLVVVVISSLRGRHTVTAFGRAVPTSTIQTAVTVAVLFVIVIFAVGVALAALNQGEDRFLDVFFEATSAVGTVGHSTGITPTLGAASKGVVIASMLVGRFGPLLLALYIARPRREVTYRFPEEGIRFG